MINSRCRWNRIVLLFAVSFSLTASAAAQPTRPAAGSSFFLWPDLAPGETSRDTGQAQPPRPKEQPPVTRLINIRRPSFEVFLPEKPNGTALLILPGGGFQKVVPDKEGHEAAPWLNQLGIAVFVLHYRTSEAIPESEPRWKRPLQDAQRALRQIRAHATEWNIDPQRVGVLGFSAGGQVAAILHTRDGVSEYAANDNIDQQSSRPDFSLLIYPWNVLDSATGELLPEIQLTEKAPPAFIVHTGDDRSSSIGSVLIYMGLKQHAVPAELHIYENGGHGYGMRPVPDSNIGTWPDRATDWLINRRLVRPND